MVLPALERLVRQVERTLEHVSLRYSDGPISRLFFSGPITAYPSLMTYMAGQLNLPSEQIDPFASAAAGIKRPETTVDRAAYTASTGLALSESGAPPNFNLTRQVLKSRSRKNQFRYAILCVFLMAAGFLWGYHNFKKRDIRALEKVLSQQDLTAGIAGSVNNRDALLETVAQINRRNLEWKAHSKKYLPVAIIGDVTSLAPEQVRFIRIEGYGNRGTQNSDDRSRNRATPEAGTHVEGVVYGTRSNVEATFAQYLLNLKRSPLFDRVVLQKKTYELLQDTEVLRFSLNLEGA
jgi:hypothetical protein